jgi:hypothetical protein
MRVEAGRRWTFPTREEITRQLDSKEIQSAIQSLIYNLREALRTVIESGYRRHHNPTHLRDLGQQAKMP